MHLVVGLGNPGAAYAGTRHNVGFAVVELLARQHRADAWRAQRGALTCRCRVAGTEALLVMPQGYMNTSGEPVGALARFYRVAADAVLVIHDELDFDLGVIRLKHGGGHGGHNGLRSIMAHLPGDFGRVRIGIGKPPPPRSGADWVLGRFSPAERPLAEDATIAAGLAAEAVLGEGMARAAGRINRH